MIESKNFKIALSFLCAILFVIQGFNVSAGQTIKNHLVENITTLKRRLNFASDAYVMVASHQGDWRNAPENSIQAIKNCISMGVDIVEIDVQMTKDSILVLMHDKTLDRTTNGTGEVLEWTYDSLETLGLRNGLRRVTKHKIPTLEEAMIAAKGKILVNIDKAPDYMDLVYKVLKKTGIVDHNSLKESEELDKIKEQYGTVGIALWKA